MVLALPDFLAWLATGPGAGMAVFVTIKYLDRLLAAGGHPLPGPLKFYLAILLSFLFPLGAWGIEIALGLAQLTPDTVFLALAVGYMVSQAIHYEGTRPDRATPSDAVSLDPGSLPGGPDPQGGRP